MRTNVLLQGWRYLWALPTTLLGLLLAIPHLCFGGRCQCVGGVLELHGGLVRWLLRHATLLENGAAALTLGHVVLGQDAWILEATRSHERAHVRQCERWGMFFLPAYFLGWFWALLRRGPALAYRENPFEVQARAEE